MKPTNGPMNLFRRSRGFILKAFLGSLIITLGILFYYNLNSTPPTNNLDRDESLHQESSREKVKLKTSFKSGGAVGPGVRLEVLSLQKNAFPKKKYLHLDLKGMPPKVSYYSKLFPALAQWGINGLLIEYEDMFPFFGRLASIANKEAYTKAEIREINKLAAGNGLEVIPLVQTFGHLEFILKLEEYQELREVKLYNQVICPSRNKSLELIRELIDQVMQLHPNAKHLHIGCDEVYYLGKCPVCEERMEKQGIERDELFLNHVKSVARYVTDSYGVRSLIWDDMLRRTEARIIEKFSLGSLVDIVVWDYTPKVFEKFSESMWEKYAASFSSVWGASAFKGADKPDSMVVNETLYVDNHISWDAVFSTYKDLVPFTGIFLTGWSRYDHFATLDEILPSAIPSLVINLLYMSLPQNSPHKDSYEIYANVTRILKCSSWFEFCEFPGSSVYDQIRSLGRYKLQYKAIQEKNTYRGWANAINIDTRFSSASHVEGLYAELSTLRYDLEYLEKSLFGSLDEIFPRWSTDEWIVQNFRPFYNEVVRIASGLEAILAKNSFPVRPLPIDAERAPSLDKTDSPLLRKRSA